MDPSAVCEALLSHVKASSLNFCLNESLFGVRINIKKSFVKDKNGIVKNPTVSNFCETHVMNRNDLEEIKNLKETVDKMEISQHDSSQTIRDLDAKLQESKVRLSEKNSEKLDIARNKVLSDSKLEEGKVEISKLKNL